MTKHDVMIRDIEAFEVLTVDHIGSYMQIGKAFDSLMGWPAARGQPSHQRIERFADGMAGLARPAVRRDEDDRALL